MHAHNTKRIKYLGINLPTEAQFISVSSVQSLSHVWLFATPWIAALQASLSITNTQSLLKLMSIESVMPSNHLILCHPLFLLSSVFPSFRVFSKESAFHIMWLKYWSFSFNISPSNEYSGLISFRMDWFDLLAVQGTLKSLLQYHSSKASLLSHKKGMKLGHLQWYGWIYCFSTLKKDFKSWKYDNAFIGDLENTEQSYI